MKKSILFIVLVSTLTSNAQSLKDLLYSGKLKSDSNTVVRKGDDLSSKIDTSTKKPVVIPEKNGTVNIGKDSTTTPGATTGMDSPANPSGGAVSPATSKDISSAPKDNNRIWKEYVDSLTSLLKAEVLPSKKIKSGTYYVLVEYEIGVDGQVTANNVSCSPENSFLQQQVKDRLTLTSPQLNPLITNGKARKVSKKQNLVLTKL